VIATRCGGPESIVGPETGILVPPRQPTELADALDRMIAGSVAFDARIIRSHFDGRYDRRTVVDQLDAVYQRALSRSSLATSTP
jgi:glycosyltransferase involved in cell wall biosynthesis